ncbi:hypothetical protein CJD36_003705 [Flavipsychrobacter stenotrophus]|uniref:Uncharacterized protein n=1 Tax=Flavipsychrobacter stenotrophus TaxID=2077091 RepID=A0A2S7T0Y9_9BACT|nr:hypothetical protein [Flavipsychrobacter stenotrophus]PQJ12860.1 hypothetical protein CJD36_003705 [Flavipsychrobacter stenotrophus]
MEEITDYGVSYNPNYPAGGYPAQPSGGSGFLNFMNSVLNGVKGIQLPTVKTDVTLKADQKQSTMLLVVGAIVAIIFLFKK